MGYFTNENSYCRFDVGLHEAMLSLGVGEFKDEVVCTCARQLTEVAAMADVLRFATLLSLIYVGVLSLPTQRKSSRLWQWDQFGFVLMSTLEEDEKAVDAYNGYVKVIIGFNHFGEQLLGRCMQSERVEIQPSIVQEISVLTPAYHNARRRNVRLSEEEEKDFNAFEGKQSVLKLKFYSYSFMIPSSTVMSKTPKFRKSSVHYSGRIPKWYTILLDKRLNHDGGGIKEAQINDTYVGADVGRKINDVIMTMTIFLEKVAVAAVNFKEFKDGLLHCGATPMHIYERLMHSKELANGLIQRALALLRQAQALNRKAKALHLRK
ncbi:hypothetical protein Tco_0876723 [Tanacetum coccineum]|uniref:Uncharacterized protein n=1 Tax=Tanacetum coccineum TaxID=301880 RepID=A0ABQ5BW12_9ASTR